MQFRFLDKKLNVFSQVGTLENFCVKVLSAKLVAKWKTQTSGAADIIQYTTFWRIVVEQQFSAQFHTFSFTVMKLMSPNELVISTNYVSKS